MENVIFHRFTISKKIVTISCFVLIFTSLAGQTLRNINIQLNKTKSTFFDPKYKATADSAFKIASAIFNSSEFQNEIASMEFDCESFCKGCSKIKTQNGRISGAEVLNKLFRESNVTITLDLRENGSALGETSDSSYCTKAWYDDIIKDMPEFKSNFAYALAVNLCHEYMHQVGFCHIYCTGKWPFCTKYKLREENDNPDPKYFKDDVTYRVGWSAYYILKKWKNDGRKIIN